MILHFDKDPMTTDAAGAQITLLSNKEEKIAELTVLLC